MPGFNPAKDKLEYLPVKGKSTVKLNKNLGLAVKLPSNIPTNIFVAWLSFGRPSRIAEKDNVGPKLVAISGLFVAEEGAGEVVVLEPRAALADSSKSLAGEKVGFGVVLAADLGTLCDLVLLVWAVSRDWAIRYDPIGIKSRMSI